MAKTIMSEVVTVHPLREWARIISIGVGAGLVYWILTILLNRYIVEPAACRQFADLALCVNATPIAGNIANILVAVIALLVMIRMGVVRPLVIVLATLAVLWGLASWTVGFSSGQILLSAIVLYAVSYALFAWVTRATQLWVTIAISLVVIVAIRLGLALVKL